MADINSPEEFIDSVMDDDRSKIYNFMINASNQANLTGNNDFSPTQLNSLFIVINPYYIEKLNIDGIDLDIQIDENSRVKINDRFYEMVEIKPGIKVFGISKQSGE